MALVKETGFDAVYAGTLEESWRQQPGASTYCTDLPREELRSASAAADKSRLTKRRELMIAVTSERYGPGTQLDIEGGVRIMRALFM